MSRKKVFSRTPVNWTSYCDSSLARSGSTRVVTKRVRLSGFGSLYVPWMTLLEIDVLDATGLQLLLELAVGDRLDLRGGHPQVAQPQHPEDRDDDVPDVEPMLPFHGATLARRVPAGSRHGADLTSVNGKSWPPSRMDR